jgi:carbonic anhydrase
VPEFLIARNSGGRARPALANLLALDDLVGLETVLVIGHTDCGAHNFDKDAIKDRLRERASKAPAPSDSRRDIDRLDFGKIKGRYISPSYSLFRPGCHCVCTCLSM